MSTVEASQSLTLSVPAGHVLSVATPAEGTAVVVRLSDVPGGGDAQTITLLAASASADFGPFATTTRHVLQAIDDALTFSTALSVGGGPGGGAESFTDLSDAPAEITANAVLAGNDAGDGLFMSANFIVAENGVVQVLEDGDSGVSIHAHGSGGLSLSAGGSGGLVISGNGEGGVTISGNGDGGVNIVANTTGDSAIRLSPGAIGKLQIDGENTVQSQSIEVTGVGTLVFKHGLLIGFTPA